MPLSIENFQVELEKVTESINRAFAILAFHNDGEASRQVAFENGETFKKLSKLSGKESDDLKLQYKNSLDGAIQKLQRMKSFID